MRKCKNVNLGIYLLKPADYLDCSQQKQPPINIHGQSASAKNAHVGTNFGKTSKKSTMSEWKSLGYGGQASAMIYDYVRVIANEWSGVVGKYTLCLITRKEIAIVEVLCHAYNATMSYDLGM